LLVQFADRTTATATAAATVTLLPRSNGAIAATDPLPSLVQATTFLFAKHTASQARYKRTNKQQLHKNAWSLPYSCHDLQNKCSQTLLTRDPMCFQLLFVCTFVSGLRSSVFRKQECGGLNERRQWICCGNRTVASGQ
jgi:hypothetical protein